MLAGSEVAHWIDARRDQIEMCFMAEYSPELNPNELNPNKLLNQDTNQAMRRKRPRDRSQMIANTRSHLRQRQTQPQVIRNVFLEDRARYPAQAG